MTERSPNGPGREIRRHPSADHEALGGRLRSTLGGARQSAAGAVGTIGGPRGRPLSGSRYARYATCGLSYWLSDFKPTLSAISRCCVVSFPIHSDRADRQDSQPVTRYMAKVQPNLAARGGTNGWAHQPSGATLRAMGIYFDISRVLGTACLG